MGDEQEQDRGLFDVLRSLLGERHARELAQELYGLGYYVKPRAAERDAFDFAKAPAGMSYQWISEVDLDVSLAGGWAVVPASRYEGFYAPIGFPGAITLHGLVLMERDAAITDAARAEEVSKARKQVDDWVTKHGAMFSGHVKIGTSEADAIQRVVGEPKFAATVTAHTKLPLDLVPYAGRVFEERDRLRHEAAETGTEITDSEATERAIANVQKAVEQEKAA